MMLQVDFEYFEVLRMLVVVVIEKVEVTILYLIIDHSEFE
jgi:hypothetical protein